MSRSTDADARWWHRRSPSIAVFVAVLAVAAVGALVGTLRVVDVLPEVSRDKLGDDNWEDPLGVEQVSGLAVAHLPECAAGAVTRIVLWDADSQPYWEVSGPPTPIESFIVGGTPDGFTEEVPFTTPPDREVVRLVVFRRTGGPAGLRYTADSLYEGRVVSGRPLSRYTVDGFKTAEVCDEPGTTVNSEPQVADDVTGTTYTGDTQVPTTTTPGG